MTSKQEGIEEDEEMGVQFGSEQPISKPRQPRRVNTDRVNDEIIRQNRDDVTSYTSQSTSIYEQAKNENTFVGEAYYYFLNNKKALEAIHGTYVIVYARPVIAEQDGLGWIVAEVFEPNIKNTLCVFTKNVQNHTEGHRKVNELLDGGLPAVGMLYFRSRNLTIWMQPEYADADTTIHANSWSGDSSSEEDDADGAFETALRDAISKNDKTKLSFGAKITQEIQDYDTKCNTRWGFEFVTLEFPTVNKRGELEMYMAVAVKIPETKDVASRFILDQRLYCPFSKTAIMRSFFANDVQYKLKYELKKKATKVSIAPRPQTPFKSSGLAVHFPLGLTKPHSSSSGGSKSKVKYKRWSSKTTEKEGDGEDEEVDIMEVDSDTDTIKA